MESNTENSKDNNTEEDNIEDNNTEDNIENEFHLSKIVIPDPETSRFDFINHCYGEFCEETESEISINYKNKIELYKLLGYNFIVYTLLLMFLLSGGSRKTLYEKFINICCREIYNSTKCSLLNRCSDMLFELTNNTSLTHITDQCCYWIGNYTQPLYQPFCEKICLITFINTDL